MQESATKIKKANSKTNKKSVTPLFSASITIIEKAFTNTQEKKEKKTI